MLKLLLLILICNVAFANPTYFSYSEEEIDTLRKYHSSSMMWQDELKKWDLITMKIIEEGGMNFYDYTRLFTCLYVAQADAAFLSMRATGELTGSFDPISYAVLKHFIPNVPLPKLYINDDYSQMLANIVIEKIGDRMQQEQASNHAFQVPQKLKNHFSAGLQVAKWIPWLGKAPNDYWPENPPEANSSIWLQQAKEIQEAQQPMTQEKLHAIYRWAGMAYPWSDDWRSIANFHMACKQTSFENTLQIRSLLMMGMYDCIAAYVTCKYNFLALRPKLVDPSIVYYIAVPKHPTYPAGHGAESMLAATIMSFFFPEDAAMWREMADQCGSSRVWSGVHYPIDIEAGRFVGKKVGERAIQVFTAVNRK